MTEQWVIVDHRLVAASETEALHVRSHHHAALSRAGTGVLPSRKRKRICPIIVGSRSRRGCFARAALHTTIPTPSVLFQTSLPLSWRSAATVS